MQSAALPKGLSRSAVIVAVLWAAFMIAPARGGVQSDCAAPPLTEAQLKAIVAKERERRQDLPPAVAEYTTAVRREGCHYTYIEYPLPRTPDRQTIFTINQHGVIVDTQPATMKCPERQLTESDLAAIVKAARSKREDLPRAYADTRTRVDRRGCLYLYFEHPASAPRDFQVFTIDPLGELISAFRNRR
jgi:hypothetical protein